MVPPDDVQPLSEMEKDSLLMVLIRYYDLKSCEPSSNRGNNTQIRCAWQWMVYNKEKYIEKQARTLHDQLSSPDPKMTDISPTFATTK